MQKLCISCYSYFDSDVILDEHINRMHVKDVRKFCVKCSKRPNDAHELYRHMEQEHNEDWKLSKQPKYRKPNYARSQRNYNYDGYQHNSYSRQPKYNARSYYYDMEYPEISTSNRFSFFNNQGNGGRGPVV